MMSICDVRGCVADISTTHRVLIISNPQLSLARAQGYEYIKTRKYQTKMEMVSSQRVTLETSIHLLKQIGSGYYQAQKKSHCWAFFHKE
nr:hypothetical protein [Tanacetum cinerariifolium]